MVGATDLANAFGSMSRGYMYDAMVEEVPALAPLLQNMYAGPTPLIWECEMGDTEEFSAGTGMDAGCPFSCLLFCVGLHKVLTRAQTLAPNQTQLAYMDDTYSICEAAYVPNVLAASRTVAKASGKICSSVSPLCLLYTSDAADE